MFKKPLFGRSWWRTCLETNLLLALSYPGSGRRGGGLITKTGTRAAPHLIKVSH